MKGSIRLKSMRLMKKLQEGQINKHWRGRWYFKFEYSNRRVECFCEATLGAYYLVLQKELNGFKCDQCKFILINSDDLMKHRMFAMNSHTAEEETRRTAQFRGKKWSLQVIVWQEWHQLLVCSHSEESQKNAAQGDKTLTQLNVTNALKNIAKSKSGITLVFGLDLKFLNLWLFSAPNFFTVHQLL